MGEVSLKCFGRELENALGYMKTVKSELAIMLGRQMSQEPSCSKWKEGYV